MLNDLRGKSVLITGGTKGIGLATALAFGRQGAHCTITHKWGSADEAAIRRAFDAAGAPAPEIVCADVREDQDTAVLMERMRSRSDRIEVFVSGAAFAQVVHGVDEYSRRSFMQSMEYTTWPLAGYLMAIRKAFGSYPRYAIGLSSGGPDDFHAHYDVVAACKGAMEALCRYLAYRLGDEDVRVNVVRARFARTESLMAMGGEQFIPFIERFDPKLFIEPAEIADAVLALCSGLMDGVNGQVIMVDRGTSFGDNLMGMFDRGFQRSIPKGDSNA